MKFILITLVSLCTALATAKDKPELRQPASTSQQSVICTVGDGKAGTEPKVISAALKKNGSASIDQEIGDYRIMAFWMAQISKVSIGVIEKVSATSASTFISENMQVGSLFASKSGQSVDLNCYVK